MKAPEQSQRDRRQVSWRTNVSSATQTKRVAVAPLNSFSCRNWRAAHCAIIWAFPLAVEQCAGQSGSEAGWKRRLTANKLAVAKISPPAASRGQSRFSPDGLACFHTQLVSVQVTRERMLLSKKTNKKTKKLYFPFASSNLCGKEVEFTHNSGKTSASRLFSLFVFSYKRVCCSEQKPFQDFAVLH